MSDSPQIHLYQNDGRIYIAQTKGVFGPNPLKEVCQTPTQAYQKIVEHAGEEPPGGEPEWPDEFGEKSWAWNHSGGEVYVITEWVWAGDLPEPS